MHVRVALIVILAALGRAPAAPPVTEPGVVHLTPAVVYASGVGIVHVPADLATVTVQVSGSATTPREAGEKAAERANVIRDALVAVGIPADSIPTGNRWRWWSWGNRSQMRVGRYGRDTSYVTTETFTARIRNLDLVGPAIDAALDAGAQSISNVAFSRTDIRGPYREALDLATRHARENADTMARASGGQVGRVLDLSTQPLTTSPAVGLRLDEIVMTARGAQSTATTIVAPEVQVTATVYARWEVLR